MDIDIILRDLAKTDYWQTIYKSSQKCSGVRLFKNTYGFSGIQVRFLYWLSIYEMLYTELSTYEDSILTQSIIDDDIRTDAYLVYRSKKQDYLWKEHRREERNTQIKVNRKKPFKHPGKESLINCEFRREQ